VCERTVKDVPCLSGPEWEAQEAEAVKASFVNESFSLASFGERRSLKMDAPVDKRIRRRCRIIPSALAVRAHVQLRGGSR
jgi:hypothetical protein